MFDRKSIKEFARFRLKQGWWMVVVVLAIAGLLGGAVAAPTLPSFNLSGALPTDSDTVWEESEPYDPGIEIDPDEWGSAPDVEDSLPDGADPGIWEDAGSNEERSLEDVWNEFLESFKGDSDHTAFINAFLIIFGVIFVIAFVLEILKLIFLGNVVTVGMTGWLLRFWRGETPPIKELFASFRIYKPAMKAMFISQLYVCLWSLLLWIPGLIKTYAYSMVPYIIYENPNLTPNQAIALSEKLTRGYKWKLFMLDMSFVGWQLLSMLTLGILGLVYVNPYQWLSCAGAYEQLKWAALQEGRAHWSDFGQMPPADLWDVSAVPDTIVAEPIPVEEE